jgi:hypothetical protein
VFEAGQAGHSGLISDPLKRLRKVGELWGGRVGKTGPGRTLNSTFRKLDWAGLGAWGKD